MTTILSEILCRFQKCKVYQNQPSETFSNFTLYIRTSRKTIEKNSNLYFYEKYIFVYNQYGLYLFPYPIQDYVDGWMAHTKLFKGLHTEICKFKEKYFSFHLTSRQFFPHNFVNIQQIWLVDGLNCFYRTQACYEQQETHLWNIFSDLYPLLLPLPPKF